MSQARYIFTLAKDEHARRTASHLAQAFHGEDADVELRDLSQPDSFQGVSPSFKTIVYADGGENTYGGYSAREFAKLFNERFLEQYPESKKDSIHDMYLIGCDAGHISDNNGGRSLSQAIADELDKNGFRKVVVHGMAKPENAKGDVLYLEVLNCSGMLGLLTAAKALSHGCAATDMQTGYLKAYLLSGADAKKIADLSADSRKNDGLISEIIRDHSFLLINHVHPEVELNKPQNIFYPRETLPNRKLRIERDTVRQCSSEQTEALALLVRHRDDLRKKLQGKSLTMSAAMDFLIARVQQADAHYWPQVVGEAARYFKNHAVYGEYFKTDNTTVKFLDALGKNDMRAANKLLGVKRAKTERKRFQLFAPKNPEVSLRTAVNVPVEMPTMPASLTGHISQLVTDLQQEINGLKKGCLAWLCFSKIRTKQAKLAVVQQLQACTSLVDAKQIARNALADSCVIAGLWHSRTNDLLHEIDRYQPVNRVSLAQANRF